MRAYDAVTALMWAMDEQYLRAMLEIAGRDHGPAIEALAARRDRPLENTRRTTVRDGIAIVPVTGPIFRYANLFTELSGATSVQVLSTDFNAALDDPQVRAVLLSIDSPGGEVNGIAELAAMIVQARGRKPVRAYVGGAGASGAYWLASAAQRIDVAPTALLGSIGVVASIRDTRAADEKAGVRTIEIVSSQSPDKRVDPANDEGRAKMQATIDRLASEFVQAVAAQRGVTVDKVLSDFGRGGVLVGADAVKAGMADGVSSLEQVLGELAATSPAPGYRPRAVAAAVQETRMSDAPPAPAAPPATPTITSLVALQAAYPSLVAEAVAGAAKAERDRILGIQSLSMPGREAMLKAFVEDGKSTKAEAAVAILDAEKARGTNMLTALAADGGKGPAPAPAAQPPEPAAAEDKTLPVEERCKAAWDRDPKIRAEFGSLGRYTAFRRAEESGQVKILRTGAA